MSQRGSVLVSVLIITTVLMILGLLAMQLVSADAVFALNNFNRARALQLAEGGIDYGIELLIDGCALGTEYPLSLDAEGEIGVVIEAHPELDHHYYINSRGQRGSAVRNVQLLVKYYPWEAAFKHAMFIGDSGTEILKLKNLTIDGETYIGAKDVELDKVVFKYSTHFAGDTVTFSETCDKDVLARITRNTSTEITPPDYTHWSASIIPEDKSLPFPTIALEQFADIYHNWGDISSIDAVNLKSTNYFTGDIKIIVNTKQGIPYLSETIIVSEGTVTFDVHSQVNDYSGILTVMAVKDIVGVEMLAPGADPHGVDPPNSPAPSIYLYSREGSIITSQSIRGLRAMIAEELTVMHNEAQTIRPPQFDDVEIDEVWRTSVIPVQWSN